MTKSPPLIADKRQAQLLGVVCVCAGAYLLYDAYEARGNSRPFWLRLLPAS